ncbi:MAG: SDR family oxidoreductase, partial [Cyclobacteriaceae bacterium]|nr:SDR family oxidoreductase [Cyclobacteriaceae bacterium]
MRGEMARDEIIKAGGKAFAYTVDITDPKEFSRVIDEIYSREGRIDVLINNAGMSITGEARDMSLDHWRKTIELNLMGSIHGIVLVYSMMAGQGSGQIVNVSSMAGLAPIPLIVPYVTSKYALVGLSRSLRMEGKLLGVKVNLVCPGRLDTTLMDSSEIIQANRESFLARVPFKAVTLDKAVSKILKGMVRNRGVLVFPGYVRWMWWMERYFPGLLKPFYRYSLRQFRKIRHESPS